MQRRRGIDQLQSRRPVYICTAEIWYVLTNTAYMQRDSGQSLS
jgi:hypothetical protein